MRGFCYTSPIFPQTNSNLRPLCLPSWCFKPQLWLMVGGNSPGTGAKKIIAPAARWGHHTDLRALLYCCVFVCKHRPDTVCTCVCVCVHARASSLLSPCSISLPHKSAHVRRRALLSLSSWWSFQIKMNLHHTNRGSGEQKRGLSAVSRNSRRIIIAIVRAIIIKPSCHSPPPLQTVGAAPSILQHKLELSSERRAVVSPGEPHCAVRVEQ